MFTRIPARRWWPSIALLAVALVAGVVAVWSAQRASALTGTAAGHNHALSDAGTTSELKGQVSDAVNSAFSYNYADTGKTQQAAQRVLTGKAVQQYERIFDTVRRQATAQKLVLTTTVTDSGVKSLDGHHAVLLVFADQRDTAADTGKTSTSATVFTVDAVREKGRWQISGIDTFTGH